MMAIRPCDIVAVANKENINGKGFTPIHPSEVLLEDFLKPLGGSW
jgi:hypothetical protein